MDYVSFVDEVKSRVEKRMGERYDVKVHPILKNNGLELQGILIFEKGKKEISPTIYLEVFYEMYKTGTMMDEIVTQIIEIYQEATTKGMGVNFPNLDFELAKNVLTYRLINYKKNRQILDDSPHIRFLDLAIAFYYLYSYNSEGVRSFRITNSIMERWNVTVKELYRLANQNTPQIFPILLRTIEDVFVDLTSDGINVSNVKTHKNAEDVVKEWLQKESNQYKRFLIMSNTSGINGASCIIYPNVMQTIAKEWDSDVFVFPSSIHEVIITPYSEEYNEDYLNNMVREINKVEVPIEDVLSDHVYLYKRETNSFEY